MPRLTCGLLERVQHIYPFYVFAHVKHAMFNGSVNSDLIDSLGDRSHRLAVVRSFPELDEMQLMARLSPGILWELAERAQGSADKVQVLNSHLLLYKYLYTRSSREPAGHLTLVEADGRSIEARYARILFDSPAA